MSSSNTRNSCDNENLCVLCFKNVDIYSVGICDHAVCFECSTRMRVLCRQNECPICRGEMPKVIFTKEIQSFTTLFGKYFKTSQQDPKYGLIFATNEIKKEYNRILEHRCSVCPIDQSWPFRTFNQLKDHMRREHELFYCDICIENVRIFSSERRHYTRQELGMHRRKGDPDNTSHRGHPLCEFCDTRFMDSDELYRHMRRIHLFCHFCDADGRHLYYKNIPDLQKHFKEEHYFCEEGECKIVPLASAYRTEIDLKAHIAAFHGRHLGKTASKQVRTLELAFTLAPRSSSSRKNHGDQNRENRLVEEGAVGHEPGVPGGGQDRIFHNALTPMDFPALAGSSSSSAPQFRHTTSFAQKNSSKINMNDFPSLGNRSNRPTSGVTITASSNSEVSISRKQNQFPSLGKPSTSRESTVLLSVHNNQDSKAPKVSIQVNHKSNGSIHTQITTTTASSSQGTKNQRSIEDFPALGGSSKKAVSQPQWVQVKSKKSEKPNKVAPAPQLPPKDLSQFPDLQKGKQNKKTSSIKVPVSNNWVNLTSLSKDQSNNNKNNANTMKQTSKENQEQCKTNKKKKKAKSAQDNQEQENKRTNSKNEVSENRENSEVRLNGDASSDSGSSSDSQKEVKKPPPGFKLPPPPGFGNRFSDFPSLGVPNDLTFTTSSGQSFSIVSKPNNYKQPMNAVVRNQNIVKKLRMVSGEEVVQEFKNRSVQFHNGQLSGQKFYDYCKTVFGPNFEDFFPEMLVLLPDIEKQQELYGILAGKAKKNLLVCENCRQVIFKKELTDHYKYHTFENQFTSRMTSKVNNENSWNK
ncbi:E3 ubiquitin-protein ligase ZNF598 [Coccinella septempunctata]|uniref:E3 ubiquitin-protein ligase ZNF598 n=1 Tax=Coccinella septempunctata TaxID=41139 RepID=UPI001D084CEE|nr:E3 ubiquitin-protein ligase ZNF598 [Coccinella septempunctata]